MPPKLKGPGDKLDVRIPLDADPDVLAWLNSHRKISPAIWEAIEGYIKLQRLMNASPEFEDWKRNRALRPDPAAGRPLKVQAATTRSQPAAQLPEPTEELDDALAEVMGRASAEPSDSRPNFKKSLQNFMKDR